MIIDTLSIAGLLSIAFYLVSFMWFGRETLRVEEGAQAPGDPATQPTRDACPEC